MTQSTHEILIAREHDRVALRRALRAGAVEQLRRGAYRPVTAGAEPADRYRAAREQAVARVVAVSRQLGSACVSRESAALLHGLRLWRLPHHVHVVQGYNASSAAAADIARHREHLDPADCVVVGGVPATSLARTVADCCATLHPLRALVLADHALASGMERAEASAYAESRRDPRGRRRARLVLQLADPGAESAWESWVRYVVLRAGLPRPRTQLPVLTPFGTYRADLGWEEYRLLVEFDGKVKYRTAGLGPQYDADRALFEEKRREDHIRDEGWGMVRVTSDDSADQALGRIVQRFPDQVHRTMRPVLLLPHPRFDRP